jgi:NAD(P)-dependent dehydrogenase (short-subunit alcohol dehydrogenase family)
MILPSLTKVFHNTTYPSLSPLRPELSTVGKVILITGGGSGIGPRLANAFAAAGSAKIAIIGRTLSTLESTKAMIEANHKGAEVFVAVADIIDQAAINDAFAATVKQFGPIDILVSNAGYLPEPEAIAIADISEWWKGFEVNIKGNMVVVQAFLKNRAAKDATIVHVSTAGVHLPAFPTMSSYASSKLSALKFYDHVAAEHPDIIVVNVHPGVLDTGMGRKGQRGGVILPFDDGEFFLAYSVRVVC